MQILGIEHLWPQELPAGKGFIGAHIAALKITPFMRASTASERDCRSEALTAVTAEPRTMQRG